MLDFNEYLSVDVKKAIDSLGFSKPTEVQSLIIGHIKEHKDAVVRAKTGSGKTAAFAIPIVDELDLETVSPRALVLTPTRELAVQVSEEFAAIGRYKRIRSLVVYGKQSISAQINQLRQRVHVVVGTPGRVNDLIRRGDLKLEELEFFVLDEADELLRRGFLDDVKACIEKMPSAVSTLLFSATMPDEIKGICDRYMKDPFWAEVDEEPPKIKEICLSTPESQKFSLLQHTLEHYKPFSCMIFCNTQKKVDQLHAQMKAAGMKPLKLHGGMNQRDRLRSIDSFRKGDAMCLTATDLGARGIHVDSLDLVINYEVPLIAENYIHRIGRTGRKNEEGIAVSFIDDTEKKAASDIEKLRGETFDIMAAAEYIGSRASISGMSEAGTGIQRKKNTKTALSDRTRDIMKLRIGIGKKKKIRAFDIVGAISNIDGIESDDIGIVEVRDSCSYVDILNYKGNIVLADLKKVKGKNVKVVRIMKKR